jgi:hypothetical protein
VTTNQYLHAILNVDQRQRDGIAAAANDIPDAPERAAVQVRNRHDGIPGATVDQDRSVHGDISSNPDNDWS